MKTQTMMFNSEAVVEQHIRDVVGWATNYQVTSIEHPDSSDLSKTFLLVTSTEAIKRKRLFALRDVLINLCEQVAGIHLDEATETLTILRVDDKWESACEQDEDEWVLLASVQVPPPPWK